MPIRVAEERRYRQLLEIMDGNHNRLALRDLELEKAQIFLFHLGGGIGDLISEFETILGMREFAQKKNEGHKYIGCIFESWGEFYSRFLELVPVFDRVIPKVSLAGFRDLSASKRMTIMRSPLVSENLGLGSLWDTLWAEWGLPGRYQPAQNANYLPNLKARLAEEYLGISAQLNLPKRGSYLMVCPEANSISTLKSWPVQRWKELISAIRKDGVPEILVNSVNEDLKRSFEGLAGVHFYDHKSLPQSDLLSFAALIDSSLGVVSVDTGAAQLSGFLHKPCITLFGPTAPVFQGHQRNINIRTSICTPCYFDDDCQNNLCMQDIRSADIIRLTQDMLSGSFTAR